MSTTSPSAEMEMLATVMEQIQPTLLETSVADQRTTWNAGGAGQAVLDGTVVKSSHLGGVPVDEVVAAEAESGKVVLHFHGGGYCIGSPVTHRAFASRLSAACRRPVLLPDYRLAPEHRFPAALDDAVAVYRNLESEMGADNIVVSGDSAGGGMAVALMAGARQDGLALPAAVVCWAPWVDLSPDALEDPEVAQDRVLTVDWLTARAADYVGGAPLDDPLASPSRGDLSGLPPLLVVVGTRDLLRPQGARLVADARQAGSPAELAEFAGALHTWMVWLPDAPETVAALGRVVSFLGAAEQGEGASATTRA